MTAQTLTYGGGAGAVASGLNLSEIGVIVGIVVAFTGLGFQMWLGLRRDKRERELHRKRMSGK